MLAATATRFDDADPVSALEVGDRPDPVPNDGWVRVRVRAAALNHHDLWTLRGVGIRQERLPVVLGCDAAGVDEAGNEVVVHAVIGDPDAGGGDETLDPRRSLLSEVHDGTLAEWVSVPARNLVAKPSQLTFEEAACLPTAWLTAYRMLFTKARVRPGDRVLVQGAGGGVAVAATVLALAAGCHVTVTGRTEERRERARSLGAQEVLEPGTRLAERADVAIETVGDATWRHSLTSLRPGGTVVVAGATSGAAPSAELNRVFFLQLNVLGSTMGTRSELEALLRFMATSGVRPVIDSTYALADARRAFVRLHSGNHFGKVVLLP
ncbi:zinc-binding dehydrogenase [Acidothermaceae bacterium B102]|nr:zinc-binding dehydrogenase [Acidothermaceae bacterium B102]